MLDLNEVYLFVTVVQAGSFAEAGRRLGMPPNTVSRRILRLESELKSRLIVRTTRQLKLTVVGQAFYEQCARNIEEIVVAGQQVADTHPEPTGPLRVALFADFFEVFPISWVTEFLDRYPGISLEFVVDNAYLDLAASGVDLALRPGRMLSENSTRRVLTLSRKQLVASPKYIKMRGTPMSVAELVDHCCLLHSRDSGPEVWYLNGPEGRTGVEVYGRLLSSTSSPIRRAAIEGLGIAFMSEEFVKSDIKAGSLVPILDEYRSDASEFCAVFPSHRHIRRIATIFVESVKSKILEIQGQ
ncbi:LysR family transcriptional regulator [Burkholderia cenocepacia]|uniref:LysR family transcriptional regulator n=1 Tax=Burkholderia cenocepacia TaxID=95486 RepID=UPI0023B9EF84|nr:LysR family transcriptional regulator [Burkholderia cenocepacia]MDF0500587.1 LysR family transcriptional regulator [Burkholderia cenocepacia]